jgi:hypothetical protein
LTLREVQNIGLNTPYDKSGTSVMRLNPLGATDVIVSRLGLGMAALGRPGYINLGHGEDLGAARDVPSIEANARRVLDAACAAGIRYFDAARSCGRGEAFLGRWQEERAIPPSAVTVSRSDWREAVPVVVASESPRWALAAIPGVTLHRQSA